MHLGQEGLNNRQIQYSIYVVLLPMGPLANQEVFGKFDIFLGDILELALNPPLFCLNENVSTPYFVCSVFKLLTSIKTNISYKYRAFTLSISSFDEEKEGFFTQTVSIAVVHFILERIRFSDDDETSNNVGIEKLLTEGVYEAAYPLHDVCYKSFVILNEMNL